MAELVGQYLGRYHILEPLGEGGMATVYKAYDTRLERDVAIKLIRRGAFPPEQLDRVLKRFEREAKSLASLSHPHIVKVLDYGEHDGSPYLALEYLSGGRLKARLGKPLPWQEAVRLLIPIAQALEYAHEHGIVHRDIKPSNILLTEKDQPMLSDFGIAKILEQEETLNLTGTGMGIGTPEYMSPEQGLGHVVDGRSDIYSLGIVLYEMVTGRKPFIADTPMAVMLKHTADPLPRPSSFVRDLPGGVEKLLLKALAKRPEDRYQNMGQVVVALEQLVSGSREPTAEPATARPQPEKPTRQVIPAKAEAAPRRVRPLRWWPWLAGGAAVVLIGSIAGWIAFGPPTTPWPTPTVGVTEAASAGATETAPAATAKATELAAATAPGLGIGSTRTRAADNMMMIYVPDGEFTMGRNLDDMLRDCPDVFNGDESKRCVGGLFLAESPQHTVNLSAYWIDRIEVTNAMYAKFLNATNQAGSPDNSERPMTNVNWHQAAAYCAWAGASLPTEAQWEKAARGTDGRALPSGGNGMATCTGDFFCLATPDGTDKSPYGAIGMVTTPMEWVSDIYSAGYYGKSPALDPTGPQQGNGYVVRGGIWRDSYTWLNAMYPVVYRTGLDPSTQDPSVGFRCAMAAAALGASETASVSPPVSSTANPTRPAAPGAYDPHPDSEDYLDDSGVPMRLVEAGDFVMGTTNGVYGDPATMPVHTVYLDSFYMDKYEVTNALYNVCVTSGVCSPPSNTTANTRPSYFNNPQFDDYPVIYISWNQARSYCEWRGARLPTEAEWEKAARGVTGADLRQQGQPDCTHADDFPCTGDTAKVGSNANSVSPYGSYDLVRNVWEWVSDWYSSEYYAVSPSSNPQGPPSGRFRALRGGFYYFGHSWFIDGNMRSGYIRSYIYDYEIGLRCAKSVP